MRQAKVIRTLLLFFLLPVVVDLASANEINRLILVPAMKLVGSSYAVGATGPDKFDCSGFVTYLYKPYLDNLPRVSRDMARLGRTVQRQSLLPGDLVFFATGSSAGEVTHVAVYLGQGSLIHAISNGPNGGVAITSLGSRYWNNHYYTSRRVLDDRFYRETGGSQSETAAAQVVERDYAKGAYRGNLNQGEPEGEGFIHLSNGDSYRGDFHGGFPDGKGEYLWKNGDRYQGAFQAGTFHGEGAILFHDGSTLSALWNRGRIVSITRSSGEGTAARIRPGALCKSYYQVEDSPWDSFNGVVEGDFALWRQNDKDQFEKWKRENQPGR